MGEWNLEGDARYPQIRVSQIASRTYDESDVFSAIRLRTLILAHVFAAHEIPAFFLESSPTYANPRFAYPIVIVFDLFDNFDDGLIPAWAGSYSWEWRPSELFDRQISDHLLRALTLLSYYRYAAFDPLYFTSFLLFPSRASILDPFLYQKVPVLRDRALRIRTVCQGGLDCVLGSRAPPAPGSFVLVPPHEHPLAVITATPTEIQAQTIARSPLSVPLPGAYVTLTRPPPLLHCLFPASPPQPEFTELCHFTGINVFQTTTEDLRQFFAERHASLGPPPLSASGGPLQSVLQDFPPTPDQILAEEVPDARLRLAVQRCLGRECAAPSQRAALTVPAPPKRVLPATGFLAEIGFGGARAPARFAAWAPFALERAGVPALIVNRAGLVTDLPATAVLERWVEDRVAPISGAKPAHFVAFFEHALSLGDVEAFMRELAHAYQQYGFGRMVPFRRGEAFRAVSPASVPAELGAFFAAQPLSEFQQQPVLAFVFAPHALVDVNAHVTFVPPRVLGRAGAREAGALAFEVYARIRAPESPLAAAKRPDPVTFKFQPPFLVRRVGDGLVIDCLLCLQSRLFIISDDIGSMLMTIPLVQASPDEHIVMVRKQIENLRARYQARGTLRKITLTLFGNGIASPLLAAIDAAFDGEVPVFTMAPAPAVQARFTEAFDDDAIAFGEIEQSVEGDIVEQPEAACFVIPRSYPAYQIAIYRGGDRAELAEFARRLSALSWLTVRPGAERRSVAWPPQLTTLVRNGRPSVLAVSRFEFLPSGDVI
jgi:hypothetical protein